MPHRPTHRAPPVLLGLAAALLTIPARATPAPCAGQPVTSFISSVIGGYQLSQPWRFPNLLATGNIGLYQVDGATRQVLDWPDANPAWTRPPGYDGQAVMTAMIALWQGRAGGGLFEGGQSPALTPDVPPSHYHVFDDSQSGRQFRWFAAGWHPHVTMLNLSYTDTAPPWGGSFHNPSSEFTDRDVADTAIALRDARMTTGAALVLPYISNGAHGHVSDSSDTDGQGNPGLGVRVPSDYATDPYYANSRRIALMAGGFGIDTPANIFSTESYYGTPHSAMFRRLIAGEIRWANRHHLTTAVFMTIFDTQHGMRGNGPDFQFMRGVQTEVRYLEHAGARPTYWIVGQYSNGPATTNMPETDTTPESIAQVATWVARHARTTPPPHPALTCTRR
ncbi:hypothetical protein HLH34_15215 [Gluconacetobacter azotocaptans]|uniref:Uncharacterized protein n=1 Tax=Gluconacetobacter azotocaptans TaxID=142834 RepID=A0A7W4PEE8_9PROT|nr:hypothetical protein [Gluconacetobacter azotocaptans]MBB2191292.1 hypothetical protein [Gluconacetobacter azotocaptans]GBQ33860.1 hypothetical protein AA13594_2733 [Gluconacetobacter azotocaptans DSM 13594]